MQAKTAIIIISYKTPWYLNLCLESLFKNTQGFHVYLVHNSQDNASHSVGDKYAKKYPESITIVRNPENVGFVEGIATVYEQAVQHKYVCLLNSDTVLYPKWLEILTGELDSNQQISMIAPDSNCYYPDSLIWKLLKSLPLMGGRLQRLQRFFPKKSSNQHGFMADHFFMAFGGGFCSVLRSDHIKKRGYILDPNIAHGYWDDLELALYLRQCGDIGSASKAYVYHFTGASFNILGRRRGNQLKQALADWNGFYVFKKWREYLKSKVKLMSPDELYGSSSNEYIAAFLKYIALSAVNPDFDKKVDSLPAKAIWDQLRK